MHTTHGHFGASHDVNVYTCTYNLISGYYNHLQDPLSGLQDVMIMPCLKMISGIP